MAIGQKRTKTNKPNRTDSNSFQKTSIVAANRRPMGGQCPPGGGHIKIRLYIFLVWVLSVCVGVQSLVHLVICQTCKLRDLSFQVSIVICCVIFFFFFFVSVQIKSLLNRTGWLGGWSVFSNQEYIGFRVEHQMCVLVYECVCV